MSKTRFTLMSLSDGSEAKEPCQELVSVHLDAYTLKAWACLWLTKEISVDSLLALCTENLVDGKTGELETDLQRAKHIGDLDNAVSSLLLLGLVTPERIIADGLDHIIPGGSTEKAIKQILDRREIVRRDLAGEEARLSRRLEQLRGQSQPAKSTSKKSAGGA
ncbi:MAG: hypothetical protein ABR999_02745 [Methanoregula sp.]|uniref:hypothetical protein n=1 Tax=Methanoregula sp. TaxID=2052170 RepID=UPI003D12AFA9